jgi:plastocyanin
VRVLLLAAALALLGGCGGRRDSTPVDTNRVTLPKSYRFDPEVIRIRAGTEVTWKNEDVFTHSVKVGDGETHELKPGEEVSLRFTRTGTFSYLCTLHPRDMKGTVIVR